MSETSKPMEHREFWITDNTGFTVEMKYNHLHHYGSCNVYHVIEISALRECEEKLKKTEELIESAERLLDSGLSNAKYFVLDKIEKYKKGGE